MALLDNYDKFAKFGDFVDLYKDMLAAHLKEPKDKHDLLRCNRLDSLIDKAFNAYDRLDKKEAIKALVEANLAPCEWIEFQEYFGGEFKTVTNTVGENNFRSFNK